MVWDAIANWTICANVDQMRKAAALWMATRSSVVIVSLAAWFLLSNHCALGAIALTADAMQMNGCPMHSAPAKKEPAPKTPCCKDVRAVIAKSVMATPGGARSIGSLDYAPEVAVRPAREATKTEGLDTGPPGRFSFAELVLQESMLAHAPPVS
jgi:hypothetical protein